MYRPDKKKKLRTTYTSANPTTHIIVEPSP
jgi:hypothetical protein